MHSLRRVDLHDVEGCVLLRPKSMHVVSRTAAVHGSAHARAARIAMFRRIDDLQALVCLALDPPPGHHNARTTTPMCRPQEPHNTLDSISAEI
jgi:hypothetical protein